MITHRAVLQVNARDVGGGAERVAAGLFRGFRRRGLRSYFAVGRKTVDDPAIFVVSTGEGRGTWYRRWRRVADKFGGPARVLDEWRGIESFHYPASYRLPSLPPYRPDIIHAHNLHGGYFDLRALPWLSRQAPLVLTLHDAWLLSGHCSHSFGCDRWKTGCGSCPDLTIYPAVRRDATAHNWSRKRSIYEESRLFVATPCRWLMEKVSNSVLAPAIIDARVIPNGVDLNVFTPGAKEAARRELGIATDRHVLLFVASEVRRNPFKDFDTIVSAIRSLGGRPAGRDVLLIALGETGPPERVGEVDVHFMPFEPEASSLSRYYQAADVYVHAARAETFPMTILEALACGTPVVATAVGGIPEQIKSLDSGRRKQGWTQYSAGDATGVLVSRGDGAAMAYAVESLLRQDELRDRLGRNAVLDAHRRFDVEHQYDAYLNWYEEILASYEPA